ncbi:MAG TPA: hypothetical protein VNS19_18915 [Acidimicrobiales bacterium]|jgi:hypothetical protein|nr:hypothetical protein [Acidimicrobiales bacterium]
MTLVELLANLDGLDDGLVIFAAVVPYARPDTPALVSAEPLDEQVGREPRVGPLVSVGEARRAIEAWAAARPGTPVRPGDRVEAVRHLAVHGELPAPAAPWTGDVVTLFRPTGPAELALIEASGWRRFPPRLPEQPIFYPVLTEAYAAKIARDWNVAASGVGYVTRFEVAVSTLQPYPVQEAGGGDHLELWVPAEELERFNDGIVGTIDVIGEYRGDPPRRVR